MKLVNRVAIVTGAGKGIGEAIALKLSQEGANLVVNDVNQEDAKKVAEKIRKKGRDSIAARADVSKKKEVLEMVQMAIKKFGAIHILVNNAGIYSGNFLPWMKEREWDRVIDVNLKGSFLCSQAVAPYMMKQKQGKIVNVSSITTMGCVGAINYDSSKAALIGFTRSLALELIGYGINVNCIAPGVTGASMKDLGGDQWIRDKLINRTPLKKIADPVDIANAVLFLVSDDSRHITGQIINVCGGMDLGFFPPEEIPVRIRKKLEQFEA